jgi:hypothetical protein
MHENVRRARELMARSRKERSAVGAFNVDDQETLLAIARAAQVKSSPVLVEVSQGEVDAVGLANVRDMVDNYRAEMGIEMYINLDHSPSVEAARAGIEAGFEFIHIDLSQAKKDATDDEIITALLAPSCNMRRQRPARWWRASRITSEAVPTSMRRTSTMRRFARRFPRPRGPGLSWVRPASTPSRRRSATSTAGVRGRRSSTSTCCVRSGLL